MWPPRRGESFGCCTDTEWEAFLDGYQGDEPVDGGRAHLAFHLRDHLDWVQRWAFELDPPLARSVLSAASALLADRATPRRPG